MKKQILGAAALTLLTVPAVRAEVNLVDRDGWKVGMYGFLETDIAADSTRSVTEIIGSSAIKRTSTLAGDNGRLAYSDRNSRLGFNIYAPEQDGWKTKGTMEFDFFGYNAPISSTNSPTGSESGFFQNPTPRIRHMFLTAENNGWKFVSGQTWSLFGWQPYYFPTIVSVSPAPGELFQRDLQFTFMKTMNMSGNTIQLAGSVERPSQEDSKMPNLNVGARWALDSYRGSYASSVGEIKPESLSIGVSGKFTKFELNTSGATTDTSMTSKNGSAVAFDTLIPLLPSENGNSLVLTGEFTSGTGYADSLVNWTGGTSQTGASDSGTSVASRTNMDAGFGGYTDSTSNNFMLLKMQTMNFSLQYVLPASMSSFINIGYAQTKAKNLSSIYNAGTSSTSVLYDKATMYYANIFHDLTKQIRVGFEYNNDKTHYLYAGTDGGEPKNNRYQMSFYYRF